jgi:hypothetical protein
VSPVRELLERVENGEDDILDEFCDPETILQLLELVRDLQDELHSIKVFIACRFDVGELESIFEGLDEPDEDWKMPQWFPPNAQKRQKWR